MTWSSDASQIVTGDTVYGSDGEKIGTVAEVQPNYFMIEKGFFFPTDYYVPLSAVASVDGGEVYLTVARDAALHSGWDTMPTGGLATETALIEDDTIVIPVMEEELTATVRPTEAGAVRIEKNVVAEDRVLEVPVTEEQIRVERRIVDRPADAGDAQAFEEIVIEVPLTAEQVELQKQARVAEEIVVSKEAVQRTEQVRGTLRREEVIVDEDVAVDRIESEGGERGFREPL